MKVLDFGLAKAIEPGAGSSPDVTQSPTITSPAMTRAGMILGTAAYMAPEQARGKTVDKRADIWAFGAVLYEMITGQRVFTGSAIPDVLAAVLRQDVDWTALPAATPPRLRRVLVRCLDRDPRMRLRDIGEARIEIDKTLAGVGDDAAAPQTTSAKPAVPRRRTVAIASAALLVGAAVAALSTWGLTRPPPVTLQPVRFALTPTAAQTLAIKAFDRDLVLSADGTHLVYVAGPDGQLMVRAVDALDAVPLGGITGARSPFLSPDGRWIGFFTRSDGEIQKVPIAGGPPVTLCPIVNGPRGGSWGPDDTIIFADANAEHRAAPRRRRGRGADRPDNARCRARRGRIISSRRSCRTGGPCCSPSHCRAARWRPRRSRCWISRPAAQRR